MDTACQCLFETEQQIKRETADHCPSVAAPRHLRDHRSKKLVDALISASPPGSVSGSAYVLPPGHCLKLADCPDWLTGR